MYKRPFIISLLTLACGLLAAIVLWWTSKPICDYVQANRLAKLGHEQVRLASKQVLENVRLLQEFTDRLSDEGTLTESSFQKQASELVAAIPDIYSIEWLPLVAPPDRAEVEADLARRGAELPISTNRRARTVAVPKTKPIRPVFYVYPLTDTTTPHLGFHRPTWPARNKAEKLGKPFLSSRAKYYVSDRQRKAIYIPVPQTSEKKKRSGALFVLNRVFPRAGLSNPQTICHVEDVTPKHPWGQSDRQPTSELTVVNKTNSAYIARQRISGRMFDFRVREAAPGKLRPNWVPWFLFLGSNLTATLIAIQSYHRESRALQVRNTRLQGEIDRRIAIERQLQGTLDFRDQERELIAHDIHDGFVQDVIGAQMYAEALAVSDAETFDSAKAKLISDVLAKAITDARQTIDYLKPRVVDEVGLIAALETSIEEDRERYDFRTGLKAAPDFPRLPLLVERMLYRMVRESVCNARQHSGENEAMVNIDCDDQDVFIEVTDQGSGFLSKEIASDCYGLAGIRHRAEVLNGKVVIKSNEYGTKVDIQIPRDFDVPDQTPTNASLRLQP